MVRTPGIPADDALADLDAAVTSVASSSPGWSADGYTAIVRFDADRHVHAGLETRTDPRGYRWDGLRRGGDASSPIVLLQYTLGGAGRLEVPGRRYDLAPGEAFAVVIPSDHRYYLPSDVGHWRFFWLTIRHPYVVQRMGQTIDELGAVLPARADSALTAQLAAMHEAVFRSSFIDVHAWEHQTLGLMLQWRRSAEQLRYPQTPRQRLLDGVRQDVLRRLRRRPDVAWLADRRGMSRSAFSHRFRQQTGQTPAAFVLQIRLEEAVRRLLQTDDKLAAIALETGFVDANHFCRVFRKSYRTSPDRYRRQMR